MNLIERLIEMRSNLDCFQEATKEVYSQMVFVVFTPEFLKFCMDHYVDPDTKRIGISVRRLADLTGVSTKSVSNWLAGDKRPDEDGRLKLGRCFGFIFVHDWTNTLNNDLVMQIIKAQHPYAVRALS